MKNKFVEYYTYSEEELRNIWEKGIIVLDTNALLYLYRCTNDTRKEFISILQKYKEQLWMPYQVALEYHRNRKNVISKANRDYKSLNKTVDDAFNSLLSKLSIDSFPLGINREAIKKCIDGCKKKVEKEVNLGWNSYPDFSKVDEVLDNITSLYENRVGDDFSSVQLKEIYAEGKHRYNNKIPPGYCDQKEKGKNNSDTGELFDERRLYGDLLIWKAVIEKAHTEHKHIVFVTNDLKEDWWEKIDGKHTPRVELIREFIHLTDQKIKLYSFKHFMQYAGIEDTETGKKAIDEIKEMVTIDKFIRRILLNNTTSRMNEASNNIDETVDLSLCETEPPVTIKYMGDTSSNLNQDIDNQSTESFNNSND